MRFPNLAWAARQNGLPHYRLAAGVGLSERRFSRGLTGRLDFTDSERQKLAAFLHYPVGWLFQETIPPNRRLAAKEIRGTSLAVAVEGAARWQGDSWRLEPATSLDRDRDGRELLRLEVPPV
jgi:hypothetical protein